MYGGGDADRGADLDTALNARQRGRNAWVSDEEVAVRRAADADEGRHDGQVHGMGGGDSARMSATTSGRGEAVPDRGDAGIEQGRELESQALVILRLAISAQDRWSESWKEEEGGGCVPEV